jgi:hypothetical protein
MMNDEEKKKVRKRKKTLVKLGALVAKSGKR